MRVALLNAERTRGRVLVGVWPARLCASRPGGVLDKVGEFFVMPVQNIGELDAHARRRGVGDGLGPDDAGIDGHALRIAGKLDVEGKRAVFGKRPFGRDKRAGAAHVVYAGIRIEHGAAGQDGKVDLDALCVPPFIHGKP